MNPIDTTQTNPYRKTAVRATNGHGSPEATVPETRATRSMGVGASVEPPTAWQSVWFAARRRRWRSLVLVPVEAGTSTIEAAKSLQAVGRQVEQSGVTVVDGTGATLASAHDLLAALESGARGSERIIAVDSPLKHPPAIALARSAEAALLVIDLGQTTMEKAEKVLDLVGRDRFVGVVSLKGEGLG